MGGYTLMSATACGGSNVTAHVLAHELGHLFLGLPDLYHPVGGPGEVWEQRRWVVGCWELMASGAWGCGTGAPTLDYRFNTFGAWTRATVGWVLPTMVDITRDSTYDLYALDQLQSFAASNPWLTVWPVVEEPGSVPGVEEGTLAEAVTRRGPWQEHDILVSGPPAMIEATVAALIRTGVHPSQINYDPFLAM